MLKLPTPKWIIASFTLKKMFFFSQIKKTNHQTVICYNRACRTRSADDAIRRHLMPIDQQWFGYDALVDLEPQHTLLDHLGKYWVGVGSRRVAKAVGKNWLSNAYSDSVSMSPSPVDQHERNPECLFAHFTTLSYSVVFQSLQLNMTVASVRVQKWDNDCL